MKLSIITCTYNSEQYIQETIGSVIAQHLAPSMFEHIFIDGYSTDSTMDIINDYKKNYLEYTITIIQSEPHGIYNAMNIGIHHAKGKYITFLNSDDFYNQCVLGNYLHFIEKDGEKDLYYGINNIVDEYGKIKYQYPHRKIYKKGLNPYILVLACYVSQSNTLYKRELHDRHGLYDENLKLVSDAKFFTQLAQHKISNKFYNHIIANFREHSTSASTNITLQEKENRKIRIELFGKVGGQVLNYFYALSKKIGY